MKFFSKLITTLIVILLVLGQNVQASYIETDSLGKKGNQQKETIVLVDVIQPLLFGKVGVGVGWRNIEHEYVFYGNYVFGSGAIPTTAFKSTEREGSNASYSRTGFDVGVQIKNRSTLPSKKYKEYIKDYSKYSHFYYGPWFEISHKSGDSEYDYNYAESYKLWEFKVGGMIGWSFDSQKSNLLFDLNIGLGAGGAFGKIFGQYYAPEGDKRNSVLVLYKVGFQIGFKL